MSQPEAWTVKRLLEWTTGFFKDHGSESPRLEAEILLAHSLKCSRIELYTRFDEEPKEEVKTLFRDLVKRRGKGEPVAYLTGAREFFSLEFNVASDVLIPRPETEHLVLETIELVKKNKNQASWKICDLGTGSGNIAVTLAKNIAAAEITAIDISENALKIARKNADKNKVSDKIRFIKSDLFAALPAGEDPFDIIVSNPPYVTEEEYRQLEPMVRDFEPKEALLAGPDGCSVIGRIVQNAPDYLKSGGNIFIEASPMIIDHVIEIFQKNGNWCEIKKIKDLSRLERFAAAVRN